MNPDYKTTLDERRWEQGHERWEQSRSGGKTFTVSVLSGPEAGAFLDYYYYSEARRKRDELLSSGVCAIMRCE